MMYRKKRSGLREQFREEESRRVDDSPTLAEKYPRLKSLRAELRFSDSAKETINHRIKYTLNLESAKSVFRFDCPNRECIRGDFDLTKPLAEAIAKRHTQVTGEMSCPGWLSKSTIDTVPCRSKLRYRLHLAY